MSNCTPITDVKNVLYTSGEYIVLTNTDPYVNVLKFTGVNEFFVDNGIGTILKKEFRYSLDNDTYSEFQELSISNLEAIGQQTQIWFQFRYILLSGGPITLIKVELLYESIKIDPFGNYIAPNIQDESKVYAYPVIYKSNFVWEPYKMNRAIRLYKDLNLMVNNLFGHDVHYYRVLPQGRSKDVFLMEYSLYEHADKVCMKIVVPDNAFPDNKLNMGPFGVDFELPFEVQVDKDYYQNIFGEGAGPQKRDVLFFPRTNRIYEVSSSYLYRDFMNEPLYFKVTLIKWLPKSNVEQTDEVNTLETFTASTGSLFGEEIVQEETKISNPQQFKVATTFEDPVRSFVNLDQTVNDIKLLNYYTVIAEHYYKMDSLLNVPLVKVDIPDISFEKEKVYYARFSPVSTQPDEQYKYSMKKFTYIGKDIDDKQIFSFGNGESQVNSLYNAAQIFGPTSSFNLYSNEYTGSTSDVPVVGCTGDYLNPYRNHVVQYKSENTFPSTEDRAYSAWFRLTQNASLKNSVISFSFDIYTRHMTIVFDKPMLLFHNDLVTIKRTATSSFLLFGNVVEIISQTSVKIEVDQEIIDFVNASFPTWTSYTDLISQKSCSRVFLNGWLNNEGFKIELVENRHVKLTFNDTYQYFSLPNTSVGLEDGTWYGLFINMSNMFKQLTVNIWKIQWNSSTNLPATTDLLIVMNKTVTMPAVDRSSCIHFYLEPSYMDLTNIRLFNRVAETDKQVMILNQNIVKDAQWSLIIDNALPQSRLPYIGYTR